MARFLFVVPPLIGHINPASSIAEELVRRGHEVAWAVHKDVIDVDFSPQEKVFSLPVDRELFEKIERESPNVRGVESVRFLYDEFCIPLARMSLQPLGEIVREYDPDILVCDHQMLAGALVARKLGIPWYSLVTTTASIIKVRDTIDAWLITLLAGLQKEYCIEQYVERPDYSPYGVIVFSTHALIGKEQKLYPAKYHFVGVALSNNFSHVEFPWSRLDDNKKKIFISFGTVSRDRSMRLYRVFMEALSDEPVQVVMVAPEDLKEEAPDNFIIQSRVPQVELLKYMDVVVCHAGHNTVCESLFMGVPLIVCPIRDDQPMIAQQVVDSGSGLFLRFGKATTKMAHSAVTKILNEDEFRQNAGRLQKSFTKCQGAKQASDILEAELICHSEYDYGIY